MYAHRHLYVSFYHVSKKVSYINIKTYSADRAAPILYVVYNTYIHCTYIHTYT